jgi:hypothetical protein
MLVRDLNRDVLLLKARDVTLDLVVPLVLFDIEACAELPLALLPLLMLLATDFAVEASNQRLYLVEEREKGWY